MKNTFVVFLFLSVTDILAQSPEKIYGKNQVLKNNEYYLQQSDLWKKETQKDPQNAKAWLNYYRASRNAYIVGEEGNSKETKGITRFQRLNSIVLEMEKNIPLSYEYNFVKWLNGNNDRTLFHYLQKAYEISPSEPEAIFSMVYYYEIGGEQEMRDKYIREYYTAGNYSPGLLNYAYNMLAGLDKNALIFTEGDKDTDASFILQAAKGIRKDVRILNVNLLLVKEYRDHLFKELGIIDLGFEPMSDEKALERYRSMIIGHVAASQDRPVYVSMSVSSLYLQPVKENLHLTGLAYLYSTIKVNTFVLLKRNYENLYLLDYLEKYLPYDISEENVKQFNLNYIPSLALFCEYYSDNEERLEHYRDLARKIGEDTGDLSEFERSFNVK